MVCVMSADNPLSRNALVTLEELKRERMILRLPTSATRELFDSSLRSMKDSPDNYNIILEVDNIATIKDLVRKNLGVSVLPQSACLKELRKGSLTALPIENLSMVRETRLVYNRDFRRKDILRTITRGVPGDGAGVSVGRIWGIIPVQAAGVFLPGQRPDKKHRMSIPRRAPSPMCKQRRKHTYKRA